MVPTPDIPRVSDLHDQTEILAHLGLQLDGQRRSFQSGRFKAQEKSPSDWKHKIINKSTTKKKQNRGRNKERQESFLFLSVQTRRHKQPYLAGNYGKTEEHRRKKGNLHIGEKRLLQGGIYHPPFTTHFSGYVSKRLDEKCIYISRKVITDYK
jgi:hypothetical protein